MGRYGRGQGARNRAAFAFVDATGERLDPDANLFQFAHADPQTEATAPGREKPRHARQRMVRFKLSRSNRATRAPPYVEHLMGWPIGWTSKEPLSKFALALWRRCFEVEK